MPSFTTMFRAIVMVAAGALVFKGWQLYGPSTEQVKAFAVRATEMAQSAWNNSHSKNKNADAQASGEQHSVAPPFSQTIQAPAADIAVTAPPLASQARASKSPAAVIPSTSTPASQTPSITPLAEPASPAAANMSKDRVQELLSRLEQLGGTDPKVAPWGSSGHLFRCCCRAPLGNSPTVTQHFESVAAEPALAVQQVVAQVEAWRTAQRDDGVLRY
jgi:hypothetical protein